MPPGSGATVLEAAEEAGAVLPVQTLVAVLLVSLLHVCGVVHLNGGGRAWTDVNRGCLLLTGQNYTVSLRDTKTNEFLLTQQGASLSYTYLSYLAFRHFKCQNQQVRPN